jgi:myo-inositol-1(or 4)-monophosphatase
MTVALDLAREIAHKAGDVLLEGFGTGASRLLGRRQAAERKSSDIDLVTEYDQRAEDLIVSRLRGAFPGDFILAEESGLLVAPGAASARWLVDPLDGTTNFAHGLPWFCVSIAREVKGRLDLGVVYAPALGLEFVAVRGKGATCNGSPIRVSDEDELDGAMLATGFPYDRHTSPENNFAQFIALQKQAQAVRRLGSAALDLALVAYGTYDAYWEMKLKPWDMAAGALLVLEAGGALSGWEGEDFDVDHPAVVATNGLLHEPLLGALAECGIPSAARHPR